jgi:predicted  nucleic acid-binding Zn-ribbon protein
MDEILDILLSVHKLSEEIKGTEKKVNDIPKKIGKLEKEIEKVNADLTLKKDRAQEIKKIYKVKEGDIQANEEQARKLNSQTQSVKTNEEYRALQKELEYLRQANITIEEEMINLLEEEEQLKGSLVKLEKETGDIVANKNAEVGVFKSELAELEEKLKVINYKYGDEIKKLPVDVRTVYERVSKARGNAVCLIKNNTCTGCYAHITHQVLNELQKRYELILCDSCGRILIYSQ